MRLGKTSAASVFKSANLSSVCLIFDHSKPRSQILTNDSGDRPIGNQTTAVQRNASNGLGIHGLGRSCHHAADGSDTKKEDYGPLSCGTVDSCLS
jgi:hypothetical protein